MITLNDSTQLLNYYEAMAVAALDNDWEKLSELSDTADQLQGEAKYREIPLSALSTEALHQIAANIQKIQLLETAIRQHAGPALESTRKLLTGMIRGRNMREAYNAHR